MTARPSRSRTIAFLVVGLLACAVGYVLDATDALRRSELDTVDARFSLRGTQPSPADIAVVKIDDVTFDELNLQWPFPRSWHGRAIDALSDDGAEVIAYDIQFTEPSLPAQDQALKAGVDRADGVVLATTEVTKNGKTDVLGGDDVVARLGADAAISDLPLDPNGVVRRMLYDVVGRKSFPIVAEELASGEEITEFGHGRLPRLGRLPRPAGDDRELLVLRGGPTRAAAGDVRGQDGRGRRDRPVAAGRAPHVHQREG